jgi:hypothetical protein
MWILIAAVVLGLIILVAVTLPLLRRLGTLRRAAVKLRRRQAEAMALQAGVAQLEQTVLHVQRRAETMQDKIEVIKAGRAGGPRRHTLPGHR